MADVSDPLLSCDADVAGSGATPNDITMDIDIEAPPDGENNVVRPHQCSHLP